MKKRNRLFALTLAGVLGLSLTGCGASSNTETTAAATEAATSAPAETTPAESESTEGETTSAEAAETDAAADGQETYKIKVLQLVQHAALDQSNQGFFAALDEAGIKYDADKQNAAGDQATCQTIAEKFSNDEKDLVFAIATPAAQAVTGLITDTPVVITAVTDPADAGLVATNDAPGGNVTGTSDLTPVKEQIDLLQQIVPEAKTVGILYCNSEANSVLQAAMAKEACAAAGLEAVDYTVSESNLIQTVVESMVGKVDAIYAPTDNMIAAGMATVGMVAADNQIPVICGEEGMTKEGGLATYGINYYELGYMAGQQAVEILRDGKDPASMPIGYLPAEKCELTVNEEVAAALGIDVSSLK